MGVLARQRPAGVDLHVTSITSRRDSAHRTGSAHLRALLRRSSRLVLAPLGGCMKGILRRLAPAPLLTVGVVLASCLGAFAGLPGRQSATTSNGVPAKSTLAAEQGAKPASKP